MRRRVEFTLPLAITVLVVQNGQGIAVLKAAGHEPPVDAITVACGVGALPSAVVGSVSTCLTGPTNAIVTASGERSRHYSAGIFTGALAVAFGLAAPAFTRLMLQLPKGYIAVLAGLAMLRVLQAAFTASFRDRFTLGALVAFLVTVADLPVSSIGAAFWGLAAGCAVSWCLERNDFAQAVLPASAPFRRSSGGNEDRPAWSIPTRRRLRVDTRDDKGDCPVIDKIVPSVRSALADVRDGATVMMVNLDVCVLGAFQVSATGDLASWHTGAADAIPAVGGAMDLAIGAKRTHVMMERTTKNGESRIVPRCIYPLTDCATVSRPRACS